METKVEITKAIFDENYIAVVEYLNKL